MTDLTVRESDLLTFNFVVSVDSMSALLESCSSITIHTHSVNYMRYWPKHYSIITICLYNTTSGIIYVIHIRSENCAVCTVKR